MGKLVLLVVLKLSVEKTIYIDILIGGLNGDENHPLVVLIKECLANEPEERPTADEVFRRLHEQQKGYSKQLIHVVKKVTYYIKVAYIWPQKLIY